MSGEDYVIPGTSPTLSSETDLFGGSDISSNTSTYSEVEIASELIESTVAIEEVSKGVVDGTIGDLPDADFYYLYGQALQTLQDSNSTSINPDGVQFLNARAENPDKTEYCARLKSILETNWSDTIKYIYSSLLILLDVAERKGNVKILTIDPSMKDVLELIKLKFPIAGDKKIEINFDRHNPKLKITIELTGVGTDEKICQEFLKQNGDDAHKFVGIKIKIGGTEASVNLNQLKSIMAILTIAEHLGIKDYKVTFTAKGDLELTFKDAKTNKVLTLKFTAAELEESPPLTVEGDQLKKPNWAVTFGRRLNQAQNPDPVMRD